MHDDKEGVFSLVRAGADVNARNCYGHTPFQLAYFQPDKTIPNFLILKGADVNNRNVHGLTSLHLCSFYRNVKQIEYLLSVGARPDITNDAGMTAVDYARELNYPEILALFRRYTQSTERIGERVGERIGR